MSQRIWLAPLLLVSLGAVAAYSQEKKPAEAAASKDDPMLMKMKELGTPGPNHKMLDPKVGRWTIEMSCTMQPGATAEKSTGTSEIKWILDGRYLQETFSGKFMGDNFQGIGTIGYDNLKKKYVSTWMDSMSTGIAMYEGTHDPAAKSFTFTGECPDPMTGKYVKGRMVEKWTDNDHIVMQHYSPGPDGKEFMGMEMH